RQPHPPSLPAAPVGGPARPASPLEGVEASTVVAPSVAPSIVPVPPSIAPPPFASAPLASGTATSVVATSGIAPSIAPPSLPAPASGGAASIAPPSGRPVQSGSGVGQFGMQFPSAAQSRVQSGSDGHLRSQMPLSPQLLESADAQSGSRGATHASAQM